MAPASGQISFTYGATEVVITAPDAGWTSKVEMPIDFLRLDDGTLDSRDEGAKYDKRTCECVCHLPAAEALALTTLVNSTARGQNLVLALPAGSGFHPFGPDKGDDGPFTVALQIKNSPSIQLAPWRYFRVELLLTNVGAWPAYSLPAQVAEGGLTIGTVAALRMPQGLFSPQRSYAVHVNFTENSTARYFDRGSGGDRTSVQFALQCNESKCAALVAYLAGTARATAFTAVSQDYFYMFGIDHGSSDTYNVRLASGVIQVKNLRYNEYELSLDLQKV